MPHIHEKYDFTVNAFIVFDGKVLMVNHQRYGFWLSPGGHVELDEDPEQALFREIEEETGYSPDEIEILSSKPESLDPKSKFLYTPNYLDVHEANSPHKHITLIYFVKAKHNKYLKSDEHSDAKWLTADELDKSEFNIPVDALFCAKEAIKVAQNT